MLGGGKKSTAFELGKLEGEKEQLACTVERQSKLIEELQSQVKLLQEALMAVHAPESYSHMKDLQYIEGQPENPEMLETVERAKKEREIMSRYVQAQEGPLFRDAEEIHDMLLKFSKAAGAPEASSTHENEES